MVLGDLDSYMQKNDTQSPTYTIHKNNGHKQINTQQVLGRLRRKENPSALLVGMQTGEATVENSLEFPQKTKDGTAF